MELVRKTVRITPDLNKRMKIAAIQLGISEQDLMEKALNQFLGGSKMNRELAIGTMWSKETADKYQWDNSWPILDESGKIIGILYGDENTDLVIVDDEFACSEEDALTLTDWFSIARDCISWNEKKPS